MAEETLREPGLDSRWKEKRETVLNDFRCDDPELTTVVDKLRSGKRLSHSDGMIMMHTGDLNGLQRLAYIDKQARFGDDVHFNVNIHVNQTNICVLACRFCAFRRGRRAKDAYQMDIEEYLSQIEPYSGIIDEVHSVGGLHPDWDVEYYSRLFSASRERFPSVHIKALTAVEIKHLASISGLTTIQTLATLKESGLGSLPGGGAEILDDGIRDRICRGKESSQEYLDIHGEAHSIGLKTNCTMLFGTVEGANHRVEHMIRLRQQQDETGGFQCFVPYPFLPDDSRLPEAQLATSTEVLRVIAVSRLMLDNIPHLKAYRMNLGDALAELALTGGADDVDGTVMQESIMHLAGSKAPLDHGMNELCRLIERSGSSPVRRDTTYSRFQRMRYEAPVRHRTLQMAR